MVSIDTYLRILRKGSEDKTQDLSPNCRIEFYEAVQIQFPGYKAFQIHGSRR
jgi:hypothetical protein